MSAGCHGGGEGARTFDRHDIQRVRSALLDALGANFGDCVNVNPSTFAERIGTGLHPNRLSALLSALADRDGDDELTVERINPNARSARFQVREVSTDVE